MPLAGSSLLSAYKHATYAQLTADDERLPDIKGREKRFQLSKMVGVRGFEPPTPASRTRCATRLRYTP